MKGLWMEVLPPTDHYFSNTSWFPRQKLSGNWTREENKLFEDALARFEGNTLEKWEKVAAAVPGKSVRDVMCHYRDLEDDVSQIEAGFVPYPGYGSSFTLDWENNQEFEGLKHSFCPGGKRPGGGGRTSDQERKKGVPWTEEEHRLFLLGLKKYGKGDWRNISRKFVMSRTPTQVASHAQKYFIRLNSGGKDKRRSSIHDITTLNLPDNMPPPSQSSILGVQTTSAPPAGTSGQFSVMVDAKQHNKAANIFNLSAHGNQRVQPPLGVTPYGMKLQGQNSHCGPLHDSMVGDHNVLFQMQSTQSYPHG
ncbi:transcription factor DIVARICATA-like [Typha latifolia]|uniref:transcription factor DIVARICATA-like n=1 Tax=Typha latifolia TaxID=4733 RepID=UPI003C2B8417